MEFPSFNHHNRYVPPPPPNNFSGDRPNLYPHNHHSHHLLRPPHLPPPAPLSYPSLRPPPPPPHPPRPVPPPPSSYNPHQSHFTFLNHSRSSPPRFSDQGHRFDYRTDSWSDPRRVLPEPPHRRPILPDDHHHRMYSPNPPSENYHNPRDLERVIPRYRDDTINDGYARRDISNMLKQDRYASAHSFSDMGKATSSSSRNLDDFVEKYEPRYVSENDRSWDRHSDEDPRWVHDMKGEKNGFNHGGDDGFVRDQSRDYNYESSKFRVREGREEFKQVQKKSVLLRIGKPNNTYRNKSHDQHFSKPYLVESNNSPFWGKDRDRDKDRDHIGKDSSFHLDQKTEGDRDRERSPVDLDVSFKSNALVAKAVVTPSSPVFDNNHTQPRNKKIKRATEFDSPLSKFSERLTRSGSSSHGSECPSSSEKASKQPIRSKDSVYDGARMGDGPVSFRLRKKRKVINLGSHVSSFLLTDKDDKPVEGESFQNSPIVPSQGAISFPSLEELTVCNVDESPQAIVLEKDCSEFDTRKASLEGTSNLSLLNVNDGLVNDVNVNQQPGENEVLLNLENETQKVSLGDTSTSEQIEIQKCPAESYAGFNDVKTQEMGTAADKNSLEPCSEEIITVFPEKFDEQDSLDVVSRKEDETSIPNDSFLKTQVNEIISESCIAGDTSKETCFDEITKFHEDGPKESSNVGANPSSSSEGDEVTEIEKSISEPIQTPSPNHRELSADLPPSSSIFSASADENGAFVTDPDDKSVDSMATNIFSSQKGSSSLGSSILISKSTDQMKSNPSITKNNESLNPKTAVPNLPIKKPPSASAVPRVFTGRGAHQSTKPRTWHRSTSNPASSVTKSSSIPVPLPPKSVLTGQNSYIRSGNTLVRKPAPASVQIETKVSAGSISKLHNTFSRTSASVVRPKTPPLLGTTKLTDFFSPPLENLPIKGNSEETTKVSEDQNGSTPSNSEDQNGKKIQYVKRKSNQLVAASSSDQPVQDLDNKTHDGYYKRRKNQLIRASVGDDSANTDVQRVSKINVKRQTGKGLSKKNKHLRSSSVWTLSSQSLGKDRVSLRQKLRPHLFPWKRSRFWGNVTNISTSIPSNDFSSSISRKLLLSRKRGMIYTKSRHGFSLRMSKLLSVGGSGLKWSKSIERNSKRANEEATLAVAAVEKKKREEHGSARATVETKSRNNMSRDRIFRIGSVRYKMDPSRRTLQRISEEEPSTSIHSKKEIRSYVPKRLVIGYDEYIRIGNGNQLVRNPKRRTRIFANEKVRWSLHTARSRLAKKRKYCQFFTRFGKCNKDDGKCPYIHDSSKIAVCTKFLNGSCSNPDCKLTHKVIPERMQDCSYFLQGLCTNEHCPYRHVNVNSAASICEGFLKGYCADGNECRKKHTYACPVFEATGTCPQGTKCKLHHPKNRNTGLKRKHQDSNSTDKHHKNTRGRYFGSIKGTEATPMLEKCYVKSDDVDTFCQEGKFAEYISLDFSNEEAVDEASEERIIMLTSDALDLGEPDLDELMKPIGIMNR